MKIKLDEGLSIRLKPVLLELGHNVDTVIDEGLKSEPDALVAKIANQNERMLFTLDKGLGDLRQYPPGDHPGIVVFRPGFFGPGGVNRLVTEFVINHDLNDLVGCLVIVEPSRLRIRRGDNESGSEE